VIVRKSHAEIEIIAAAGAILAGCLRTLTDHVRPGVNTRELDELADAYIRERGARPTFKGYRGFPKSICTSPNDMVVHGIPGKFKLRPGDILSLDVGVTHDGFVADAALTVPVGRVSAKATKLMDVTAASLQAGIEHCHPGERLGDISHAVQQVVEAAGFNVVRSLVGHGVGRQMHEDPQIPNFGDPGRGPRLEPGMVLAIEPMVNAGGHEVYVATDGWSIRTADGSLSAHFEHTVAVTEDGPRVLTRPQGKKA
jgi:methionyl aminopeptidase